MRRRTIVARIPASNVPKTKGICSAHSETVSPAGRVEGSGPVELAEKLRENLDFLRTTTLPLPPFNAVREAL